MGHIDVGLDEAVEVDNSPFEALFACEGKQLLSQRTGSLCGAARMDSRLLDALLVIRRPGSCPLDDLDMPHHDLKKIVEVVRDATCQLSQGFHLLGLAKRVLCIASPADIKLGGEEVSQDTGFVKTGEMNNAFQNVEPSFR